MSLPCLILLDDAGRVITRDGVLCLRKDPTGAGFPWRPKSISQLLRSVSYSYPRMNYIGMSLDEILRITNASFLGLLFAGPCRDDECEEVMGELMEATDDLKCMGLEVVHIPSYHGPPVHDFSHVHCSPWTTMQCPTSQTGVKLSEMMCLRPGPAFVLLDSSLRILTRDGIASLRADPFGKRLPWYEDAVKEAKREFRLLPAVMALYDVRDDATFYLAPANLGITEASVVEFVADFKRRALQRMRLCW